MMIHTPRWRPVQQLQWHQVHLFNSVSDTLCRFKKTVVEKFQAINCQALIDTTRKNKLLFGAGVASLLPGGYAIYSLFQKENEARLIKAPSGIESYHGLCSSVDEKCLSQYPDLVDYRDMLKSNDFTHIGPYENCAHCFMNCMDCFKNCLGNFVNNCSSTCLDLSSKDPACAIKNKTITFNKTETFENVQNTDMWTWIPALQSVAGCITLLAGVYFCIRQYEQEGRQQYEQMARQQRARQQRARQQDENARLEKKQEGQELIKIFASREMLGKTVQEREDARNKLLELFPNEHVRLKFDQARSVLRDKKFITEQNQVALSLLSKYLQLFLSWEFPVRINFEDDLGPCFFEGVPDSREPNALSNSKLAILLILAESKLEREEMERYLESIKNILGANPEERRRSKSSLLSRNDNLIRVTFKKEDFDRLTQAPRYFIASLINVLGTREKQLAQKTLGSALFAGFKDDDEISNEGLALGILVGCLNKKEGVIIQTGQPLNEKSYETLINIESPNTRKVINSYIVEIHIEDPDEITRHTLQFGCSSMNCVTEEPLGTSPANEEPQIESIPDTEHYYSSIA